MNHEQEIFNCGHYARELTNDEVRKLNEDTTLVTPFKQNQLELQAQKNWDLFYKRNSTNFFKDRHWTIKEFPELSEGIGDKKLLLEVGCGVGNFTFPLIDEKTGLFIYACDFSNRAVEFVKINPLYDETKCRAFQCDVTCDSLDDTIAAGSIDIVTMIFVLSAIHPDKMVTVLRNVYKVLKPGGLVLFRDYGLYDQAMLRFGKGHKLADNFYVRQDGTRAYYFSEEYLTHIFQTAGYKMISNQYVRRKTVNKKEDIDVPRVFIQGKFCKA